MFDKLVEACVKEDMECNNYGMEEEEDDLFDEDDDDLLSDDNRGEIRDGKILTFIDLVVSVPVQMWV